MKRKKIEFKGKAIMTCNIYSNFLSLNQKNHRKWGYNTSKWFKAAKYNNFITKLKEITIISG
jgi:hypothetical protein